MLTHARPALEGGGFYLEKSYYRVEGQPPSEWYGTGAKTLGLEGAITDATFFDALLKGQLPNGTRLPNPPSGRERRRGDDWTFSPPKSISIVALVGKDKRVVVAHDRAVQEAVRYMELEMFGTRGMVNDRWAHVHGGAVVGIFRHERSRPVGGVVDPQLHTHTVWINASLRDDREWRAIDWRLYRGAKWKADKVYLNELSSGLRNCGYELAPKGTAYEINGIPPNVISAFSRRARHLDEELSTIGRTRRTAGRQARHIAILLAREGKDGQTKEAQWEEWDERARNMDVNWQEIISSTDVASRKS